MDRKHKVKITVAGTEYIVLTHESESYTRGLAEQVDESIQDMCINGRISITAAAILTAVNLCDKLKKYENDADALGEQIEKYLEAANEQMNKYNELKTENERLKKNISVYRKRLGETVDGINEPSPVSESVKTVKKKVFVSDSEEMADEEQDIFRNLRKEE
ncbi:MAG: cell division protein ZapA [Clostridia bacterium]|nr:cell division protein ZapA [Clostridia bacterium]